MAISLEQLAELHHQIENLRARVDYLQRENRRLHTDADHVWLEVYIMTLKRDHASEYARQCAVDAVMHYETHRRRAALEHTP